MLLSIEISAELEQKLKAVEKELPMILELGLREHLATSEGRFNGTAEVLEFLATLPSPEDILELRPSTSMQNWINELVQKSKIEALSSQEEREWEQYQYLEHLVRQVKIQARVKLNKTAQ